MLTSIMSRVSGISSVRIALARRTRTSCCGLLFTSGKFRRLLAHDRPWPEPNLAPDENVLFVELQKLQGKISSDLARFGKLPLTKIFKFLPVWLVAALLLGVAAADPIFSHFKKP